MALTWRGMPVVLTWNARIKAPLKEWSQRFVTEVEASDAAGEDTARLAVRLHQLAAELGAVAEIRPSGGQRPLLSIRLVRVRIVFLPGCGPRRERREMEVVYVGGPQTDQRERVTHPPAELARDGGHYRRALHCAIDDAIRYLWVPDAV